MLCVGSLMWRSFSILGEERNRRKCDGFAETRWLNGGMFGWSGVLVRRVDGIGGRFVG